MGFFSKLFGKKKSDTKNALQSNDDNHNSNLSSSQNQQEDCLISFETFTGLNEDAIKEIVFKKTTDYNEKPDQNILIKIRDIKGLPDYDELTIEKIEKFYIENYHLLSTNFELESNKFYKKLYKDKYNSDRSYIEMSRLNDKLEYLIKLKHKDILFFIKGESFLNVIFLDDNNLKYVCIIDRWDYGSFAYDLLKDFNWILKEFFQGDNLQIENLDDFTNLKNEAPEAFKRYDLYNKNTGDLFNYYYLYLKQGGKHDNDNFEWGNLFIEIHYDKIHYDKVSVDTLKLFIFMNNLYHFILKIIEPEYDKAKSRLRFDNQGDLELTENVFDKLFRENQNDISNIDKNYVHKFVKLSSYIKDKSYNITNFYGKLKTQSKFDFIANRDFLEEQINNYNLILYHSINMLVSLLDNDLITFYEIHDVFDKKNLFNSNWEKDVSNKLAGIENKMDELIHSVKEMDLNLSNELYKLNYMTQSSLDKLSESVNFNLKEVESSINSNNLLAGIQAYQLYKINKNTKGVR